MPCEDCFFKTPSIGNRGPEDSPFVIVGESPGIMEIHYKKPFVGPSGDVINETLERVGASNLPFEPLFMNAVACLPKKGKDAVENQQKLVRACIACRKRLLNTIRKHPRKLILSLGNAALWSLTGNFSYKITKERGKLFESDLAELGIVTAVHPAFLLRGAGNYTQFERDVEYAVNLAKNGINARKLPDGTSWGVIESEDDALELQSMIQKQHPDDIIASDIETTGFSEIIHDILCVGFQLKAKESYIVPKKFLKEGMFSREKRFVWHNGKFDCRFLRRKGFNNAYVAEDTLLLSYTLNERRGIHDLDQVASDWLGSPNHKSMVDPYVKGKIIDPVTGVERKRNYGDIPEEILWKYLALDLNDTFNLFHILHPKVDKDPKLRKFYNEHLLEGSEYLLKVESNGMLVDWSQVKLNDRRLLTKMQEYEGKINEIAISEIGAEVNPRSPKQLKALLYDHLKLGINTLGTDKDTLEKLVGKNDHPILRSILRYREVQKGHSTYVKNLMKGLDVTDNPDLLPDGYVHQTYLLHGTPTSRLSCVGPNLQNIPRDPLLRGQYIAEPGYIILECDYSQAELRSLACLSECPDLMGIFLRGEDLHVELSKFLFGENYTHEDKMKAKTVNFGIVYGRTAISIALAFNVSVKEALSWIEGWFTRFPGAAKYIEKCRMAPVRNQTISTCFGNKKRPGVVSYEILNDLQNQSANFPHQSIASNLTVRSGIELFDPLRDDFDTHIRNTVHDCLVTTTPENFDHIRKVANFITTKMEEIPLRYAGLDKVPFKASAEIGWRWGNLVKIDEVVELYDGDVTKIPSNITEAQIKQHHLMKKHLGVIV